jgi:predicted nucleic acid-binding protein
VIALDTSVLVDVLTADPRFVDASGASLAAALGEGDVVVCDAVVAEMHAMLDASESTMDGIASLGIRYLPVSEPAAVRAGHMQRRFRQRGGRRERVIADFLIGSHAMMQCGALITRDDGFFRDYFKGLRIIVPRAVD